MHFNDYFNVKNIFYQHLWYSISLVQVSTQFNPGQFNLRSLGPNPQWQTYAESSVVQIRSSWKKNKLSSLFLVWVFVVSTFSLFHYLPGWFFIFSDIISNLRLMLMPYYKLCHAICVIIVLYCAWITIGEVLYDLGILSHP